MKKEENSNKISFIQNMRIGMRTKTIFGNGVIESIIEDVHCSVNVLMDSGERKNIALYDFTDNGLKINLDYENS